MPSNSHNLDHLCLLKLDSVLLYILFISHIISTRLQKKVMHEGLVETVSSFSMRDIQKVREISSELISS